VKYFTIEEMNQRLESDEDVCQGFCDAIDVVTDAEQDGLKAVGVKTTLSELAGMNACIITGEIGKPRFSEVSKLYPDIEVYTVYYSEANEVGSCDMFIENNRMGKKIQKLTGLRYDDAGETFPGWRYFEAE